MLNTLESVIFPHVPASRGAQCYIVALQSFLLLPELPALLLWKLLSYIKCQMSWWKTLVVLSFYHKWNGLILSYIQNEIYHIVMAGYKHWHEVMCINITSKWPKSLKYSVLFLSVKDKGPRRETIFYLKLEQAEV